MRRWACVARLGGVGDNLIAASVLRPLKRMGYNVEVITSEYAQAVYLNNPFIDKLSIKGKDDIPSGPNNEWQKWFVTRSREYDRFVHLSHSCEVRHSLQPVMTAFWASPEYRRKLCAGSYLETVHDMAGVPYDFGPMFFPTDEERDRALNVKLNQIGGRYAVWVIAGSRIDKIYPYAAMAIARMVQEMHIPVVMVGVGGKQFEMAKQMAEHIKRQNGSERGVHLALSPDAAEEGGHQHWPLRRSLTQACTADLVITPDTGVAWAVAMEQMPKLVLLSHGSVENVTKHWVNTETLHADPDRVPCWPCHRLHDDIETCTPNADGGHAAACISDISVDRILDAVRTAWDANSNVVPLREAAE